MSMIAGMTDWAYGSISPSVTMANATPVRTAGITDITARAGMTMATVAVITAAMATGTPMIVIMVTTVTMTVIDITTVIDSMTITGTMIVTGAGW